MLLIQKLHEILFPVPPKKKKETPLEEARKLDLWDDDTRIIDLTDHGDWLTLGDCYSGLGAFGGTGSGKTSSLAPIAQYLIMLGCGFVWMCAKPDEVRLAMKIAASAGRGKDVVIIGENPEGRFTRHCFNPFEYEGGKSSTNTQSIVSFLADCEKVLSRKEGEKAAADGERFWQTQFEMLLLNTIDTAKLAGKPLTIQLLREIQLTAPKSREELSDEDWIKTSMCSQCLLAAEARYHRKEILKYDLDRIASYWCRDYTDLDQKPRSSIDIMFAALVNAFTVDNRMRAVLCGKSTITPDDVMEKGKIVILSLPTNIYHNAGRMAQFAFKHSFQRAMLARRKPLDGSPLRPCVLWVDEAHAFAHPSDAQYFREVRSNKGISVFLEQGIGGYMQTMNFHSPHQVDDFLQNISTKFFFNNSSPETNRFAADAIGKLLIDKDSQSYSYSMGNSYNVGDSTTQEERHQVVSGDFAFLKRGGRKNDGIVEAIVLRPEIFNLTGTNYALCQFLQTDLTG